MGQKPTDLPSASWSTKGKHLFRAFILRATMILAKALSEDLFGPYCTKEWLAFSRSGGPDPRFHPNLPATNILWNSRNTIDGLLWNNWAFTRGNAIRQIGTSLFLSISRRIHVICEKSSYSNVITIELSWKKENLVDVTWKHILTQSTMQTQAARKVCVVLGKNHKFLCCADILLFVVWMSDNKEVPSLKQVEELVNNAFTVLTVLIDFWCSSMPKRFPALESLTTIICFRTLPRSLKRWTCKVWRSSRVFINLYWLHSLQFIL